MSIDRVEKLQDLLKLLQKDTLTPKQVEGFLDIVLQTIKVSKESFENLSAENIATVRQNIALIEAYHQKAVNTLDSKTNALVGQFEGKIAQVKDLIDKVKTIKPIDGVNGLDGLPGRNGSPDGRIDIVKKINTGGKLKIEAKQVEGLEKKTKDLDFALGVLDQRTQFLINKQSTTSVSSTTPGGSDTQIQFNDGSSFGGDAGLTYAKTTDTLTVTDTINVTKRIGVNKTADSAIGVDVVVDGVALTQGLRVRGTLASDLGFSTFITGDTFVRYTFQANGVMNWGSGALAGDTVLYRNGVGILRTDATLRALDLLANTLSGISVAAPLDLTLTGASSTGGDNNGASVLLVAGNKSGAGSIGNVKLKSGGQTLYAILDTSSLASTDKTFTFPNTSGTLALTSDIPTLASGVYTPTRSAEVNLDANVTMTEAQYLRVGSTVTVSGRFTADPTTTTLATSFEITLPVASNIGAAEDVAGTAFCGNIVAQGGEVIGVAANDTAKIQWKAADVTSQVWSYTFSYQII